MYDNYSADFSLLDTGMGFTVFDKQIQEDVPYGAFALTLANTDYGKMRGMIERSILRYVIKRLDKENLAESLYEPIQGYLSFCAKGYLKAESVYFVTQLLIKEIMTRLVNSKLPKIRVNSIGLIYDENKGDSNVHMIKEECRLCVPKIFSDDNLKDYIICILKREHNGLQEIYQLMGKHEINSKLVFAGDRQLSSYDLYDAYDYLLIDLQWYLERTKKSANECKRCGRLFLPSRKNDKYCRLPNMDVKNRTCNEIMKVSPQDKYVKERNSARDRQHRAIRYYKNKGLYSIDFFDKLYCDWSDECGKKYAVYKEIGNLQGFQEWIKETRFTKAVLAQKWKEHQEKTSRKNT